MTAPTEARVREIVREELAAFSRTLLKGAFGPGPDEQPGPGHTRGGAR